MDDENQGTGGVPAVRIVLVAPQHPGNIGAAARAMKAMGLADLALVAPDRFPHAAATARAAGADDVLAGARVVDHLDAALTDCTLVIGTSARSRRLPWPVVDAREAAYRTMSNGGPTAIVFGRERSGLTNEELDRCHVHLQIPCNPDFASLNLAAAVQLVCYELRMAAAPGPGPSPEAPPLATAAELEGLYDHLEAVARAGDFLDPDEPRHMMRRFRRLLGRRQLEAAELRLLRGLLRALDPRRRAADAD
ncbi:RNA methyltransferase [Spectribacter hydrogenoxidans]|uniref:tRNA (cytidine/uridine-2'-O-)-methyltransferase TrmJ n=1 Tax=Spectribacter hydrogenoxidans TaxID=3075608 RepID=A0ABU3BYG7_9GAMM|nr:RNA methyltransferase [Salinisphaera sp. W335]MDT0634362.1 RNA methyltransferase [Salinisphaera sp. W335]